MKKLITLAAALLLTAAPAGAATLIIDSNGILIGATGVDVGGTLFDVSFVDGSCVTVFSGCDSGSDFAFSTIAQTALAGDALLAQVFIGAFDTQPRLTNGCGNIILCETLIPFAIPSSGLVNVSVVVNNTLESADRSFLGPFTITNNLDLAVNNNVDTFARFTLASATGAVPEPSTWAMMLMGFGAMGVVLRRRRRANASQFA